jgi:hypothetical protein
LNAYLKKRDIDEDEEYAGGISSFAVCTGIPPLKKGFCKENAGKRRISDD